MRRVSRWRKKRITRPPGQDLSGEEVGSGKDRHVGSDEVLPSRGLAAFRRWRDAVPIQNVPDRLVRELVAEIGESASDAIVTPACVFFSHADNESLQIGCNAGPSRVGATLRAVELAGDQTAIPSEDGFGLRNTGYLRQALPPEALADFGESRALGIRKTQSSGDVGAKDSILRNQIFALEEKALIDQASHVRQQSCPTVLLHAESIWYRGRTASRTSILAKREGGAHFTPEGWMYGFEERPGPAPPSMPDYGITLYISEDDALL
jgi:hypothetical protein